MAAAALALLSACQKEEDTVAKATLMDCSSLNVEALGVAETAVNVISDGDWTLIECPDWVSVTPSEGGAGQTEVTVKISDNLDGSVVDLPRTGNVVVGGAKIASRATLAISQAGDKYKEATVSALKDMASVDDGKAVSVKNATVVAETSGYSLIADGEGFAWTDAALALGRKATVKGVKSMVLGLPCITESNILDETAGDDYSAEPEDITSTAGEYSGSGKYAAVEGIVELDGENVTISIESTGASVSVAWPSASLELTKLGGHLAVLDGYAFRNGDAVFMVADKVLDKGMTRLEAVLAQWNFSESRDINGPTFTGVTTPSKDAYIPSEADKNAGDGGRYVSSTAGSGRITYVNVDKTDVDKKNYSKRRIDADGNPNVTGSQAGDCWMFTADLDKVYAAGSTVTFTMSVYASAGGLKYWTLEIYDGGSWVPMMEMQTETATSSDGKTTEEVTFNYAQSKTVSHAIEVNYNLVAAAQETIQIRYRAMSNMATGGKYKSTPDGGVHRIENDPVIRIAYDR